MDAETLSYFREVDAHVRTHYAQQSTTHAPDADDVTLPPLHVLVQNVLEEIRGRETEVVCDAECSRIIEAMLPHASGAVLEEFSYTCLKDDNLGIICTSYVYVSAMESIGYDVMVCNDTLPCGFLV